MMKAEQKIQHKIISDWIKNESTILDLGCGDGELITQLITEKAVRAQGIEISDKAVQNCIAAGLSVFQEDIDSGLSDFVDKNFDYVVLNQTFQQVKKPDFVLHEALRVGKNVIVGFPNFCFIWDRFQIFFKGKVPVTSSLPYEWYDTPNLHFLSIADFKEYCQKRRIRIERSAFISGNRQVKVFPNLFGEIGLFLLSRNNNPESKTK